jgi:hypothetical protein
MPTRDPSQSAHNEMAPTLSESAWAALHQNNWQIALEIIPYIDFNLDDPHYFRLLCCTYLQSQHWRALSAVASIAAERFPSEPIFWEIWAWAEHIQGNTKAALKILESLIPAFCHRESTACILAYLYAASHKYSEAAHWFDLASLLPANPRSIRLGTHAKAEFHFAI